MSSEIESLHADTPPVLPERAVDDCGWPLKQVTGDRIPEHVRSMNSRHPSPETGQTGHFSLCMIHERGSCRPRPEIVDYPHPVRLDDIHFAVRFNLTADRPDFCGPSCPEHTMQDVMLKGDAVPSVRRAPLKVVTNLSPGGPGPVCVSKAGGTVC